MDRCTSILTGYKNVTSTRFYKRQFFVVCTQGYISNHLSPRLTYIFRLLYDKLFVFVEIKSNICL